MPARKATSPRGSTVAAKAKKRTAFMEQTALNAARQIKALARERSGKGAAKDAIKKEEAKLVRRLKGALADDLHELIVEKVKEST